MVVSLNFPWLVMSKHTPDYGALGAFDRSRLITIREIYGMALSSSSSSPLPTSLSLSLSFCAGICTCSYVAFHHVFAWQIRRIATNGFITTGLRLSLIRKALFYGEFCHNLVLHNSSGKCRVWSVAVGTIL